MTSIKIQIPLSNIMFLNAPTQKGMSRLMRCSANGEVELKYKMYILTKSSKTFSTMNTVKIKPLTFFYYCP